MHFLLPEMFSSSDAFEEWFSAGSTTDPGGGGDGEAGGEAETEVVSQLHKVLRPFLLRRLKSDVEKGLPPKKETILKIGMSELQKKTYGALLQRDIEAVNGAADRSRLLNVVMQLRKCCNHPYLFQGTEPGPPYTTGEHLVEASGKMVLLDKLLPKLQSRDSRVLIFSQVGFFFLLRAERAERASEEVASFRSFRFLLSSNLFLLLSSREVEEGGAGNGSAAGSVGGAPGEEEPAVGGAPGDVALRGREPGARAREEQKEIAHFSLSPPSRLSFFFS